MLMSRGLIPPVIDMCENDSKLAVDILSAYDEECDKICDYVVEEYYNTLRQFSNEKYSKRLIIDNADISNVRMR